jgi:four helix bundle protein
MTLKFERLSVWQKAVDLTANVHDLTRKFPREELYVLTSQMKRAADSIALNIAEGSTGQTDAEFKQFLGYAIRSTVEVIACLYLGRRRGLVSQQDFTRRYDQAVEILKMVQGLRNSLR